MIEAEQVALALLLTGLGCQALVDVSQYRFDDDGGTNTGQPLQPPGSDAGDDDVADEGGPSPGLEPEPPVDAGAPSDSSGTDDPPPSGEPEPPPDEPEPDPDPVLPPVDEPEPPPAEPPPDPGDDCSLVEFCRAYEALDTIDEERCLQRGCSVEAALAECREEVLFVCGNVQPPFVLYTLDGDRLELQ